MAGAEEPFDSVVSLRGLDGSVNASSVNQNDQSQSVESPEYELKILDTLLSIVKSRILFLRSKYEAPLNSSRYISARNATNIEKDYDDSLNDLYFQLEMSNILERIFQRGVESSVLWEIVKRRHQVTMNDPIPPMPPLLRGPDIEKSILNSMASIANKSVGFEETWNATYKAMIEKLDATHQDVNQLEKFRLHKGKLARKIREVENKEFEDIRERQRKCMRMTNTCRGIITHIVGGGQINFLENPELVEIIKRCRNKLTQTEIEKESSVIYTTFTESIRSDQTRRTGTQNSDQTGISSTLNSDFVHE